MVEERDFKVRCWHLLPVVLVLMGSLCFAISLDLTYGVPPPVKVLVFEEEEMGAAASGLNALYYTSIIAAAGLLLYLIIKTRFKWILKLCFVVVYGLMVYLLSSFYFLAWFWLAGLYQLTLQFPLLEIGQLFSIALVIYLVFVRGGILKNVIMLTTAAGLGAFFGFLIPTLSLFVILIAISAYDIFAVYKGPLGKLPIDSERDILKAVVLSFGDKKTDDDKKTELMIGMGDLFFYSLLAAHAYFSYGIVSFLAASGGLVGGFYLTLKILERKGKMVPGLPISIILGILFSQSVCYLQAILL